MTNWLADLYVTEVDPNCWVTQLVELFMYNYNKLVSRLVTIHVQNGKLFLVH